MRHAAHISYPFFPFLYLMCAMMITLPACTQTYYLVRHAEKACEDCANCGLSEPEGSERAMALKSVLRNEPIDRIYASQCLRTQLTVKPIADALGIPVQIYQTNDLPGFIRQLKNENRHDHILIAGHSNQVPVMVDSLAQKQIFITDSDFDNLYIIRKSKRGRGLLEQKIYGVHTH